MSRRRPVVAGNWKMHKTVSEAISFARDLAQEVSAEVEAEVIVSPPFTALADVCRVLADGPVSVAAQNVHWGRDGAFTGEISVRMLAELGGLAGLVPWERQTGEHGGSNGAAGY